MAETLKHINYTFEDIQRYLQGNMSAAEMHNMEKAALQDPFLADAIEGYTNTDAVTAQQHLNEINAGLFAKDKKTKVVAFNKKTQWLNVAAIIIVIAGIGFLGVYMFNNSNRTQDIAQVKKEPALNKQAEKDSGVMLFTPHSSDVKKEAPAIAQNQTKPANNYKEKKSPEAKILTGTELREDEAGATSAVTSAAPADQNEMASRSFANADVSNQKTDTVPDILPRRISGISIAPTIFAGKVTDEKNQPVAGAVVESTDKSITVLTDNNGNFRLFKSDTVLNAMASTVGYESKTIKLQPGDSNLIMLKPNNVALNDVAVVGYGTKRKNVVDTTATPVGGWKNFNNYVLNQLNKDSGKASITNPEDLVELEFMIDNNGDPYNIQIVKPLDDIHNSKAVEILKKGPKWANPSKKKKAKVTISF